MVTSINELPKQSTAPPMAVHKVLSGQKALVTSANSGIGKAVAIALGEAGAEIRKFDAKAYAHRADVSSEDAVAAMFKQMVHQFGTIDILVNNAGLQRDAAFQDMTLASWNKVLDVNLTGQFPCAREAIREFLRRGVVHLDIERLGQDRLHEFGPPGNSMGRTR